ncbi:MAG: transcription-repair coupling factor [Bacteroidales bacterium]|nr:transcription-repair coupling factor [Bacteroidales bacterium]
MQINDIAGIYEHCDKTGAIAGSLHSAGLQRIHLKGLKGSARAFYISALARRISSLQLCILPDKETASFFFGDLECIFQEQEKDFSDRKVLFYAARTENKKMDSYMTMLRNTVLQQISEGHSNIIVSYPEALSEKVADISTFKNARLLLKTNQIYGFDALVEDLSEADFEYSDYVVQPGQFAIRGGLIDVFSYTDEHPVRIEFKGDMIASIRLFDIESQLTKKVLEETVITADIQNLNTDNSMDIMQLLPDNTCIWIEDIEACEHALKKFWQEAAANADIEVEHTGVEDFKRNILRCHLLEFGHNFYTVPTMEVAFNMQVQMSYNKQFDILVNEWIEHYQQGICNIFAAANENQSVRVRNIVWDMLQDARYRQTYGEKLLQQMECNMVQYVNYSLHEGFVDKDNKLALYTDHQVFNRYHRYKIEDKYRKNESLTLKELYDLKPGDYVTHINYGIGQYAGLEKIDVGGKQQEAIKILYKDKDVLYISIHSLHRIAKYSGKDGMAPALHRLGSNAWNKVKEKAKTKVKQLVFDLTKLYAERKAADGYAFSPDNFMQNELEASFVYEDTPDQIKATAEVKKDMEASYPMDRLICGDVGFGKTEIAIRAAFKAVCDNKQVAVLVPTTVLALQHYNTFRDRLSNFPCSVDYVNRFKSAKQQKEILQKLKKGQLDIIIGTHRLLGKDVEFKDLGLLIVDEEQKFGVGDKEKLRCMKVNVDTLTMTATPIPRTLQFSLMGARDISIMRTPPLNRYPIETSVKVFDEHTLFSAIDNEVSRNGQVFVVHNRVQNINEIADLIRGHFPNHKVAVAHGQMEGNMLEKIMLDFIDGYYDILVSTAIIESGLDIPNANTIIINEAQNFGLSELHQLRGRVGRNNKKAFCYLLTPPRDMLSSIACKRLDAIEEYADIGSGFNIAMRDLDIRGAGNLLGAEQSGFITEIGYEMYQKILQEAIEEMQESTAGNELQEVCFVRECAIETDMELFIPDSYVYSGEERFALYKELNGLSSDEELELYANRLIDRFGDMPAQTSDLITSMKMRNRAKEVGFERIVLKQKRFVGYFPAMQDSAYYESQQFVNVLTYVQSHPQVCHMKEQPGKLTLTVDKIDTVSKALQLIETLKNS